MRGQLLNYTHKFTNITNEISVQQLPLKVKQTQKTDTYKRMKTLKDN